MRLHRWILIVVVALPSASLAQTVLMEAPLILQAPGHEGVQNAWWDGSKFWIDPQSLLQTLGFEIVESDSTEIIARDQSQSIRFDFATSQVFINENQEAENILSMRGPSGETLTTLGAVQSAFGADVAWIPAEMTLRLSSAATQFTAQKFSYRKQLSVEPQGTLLSGKPASLIGGIHVGYDLRHEQSGDERSVIVSTRTTADIAGGTLRWYWSRHSSRTSYTVHLHRRWLTSIQVEQSGGDFTPTFRITNAPLRPRVIQRKELIRGTTVPHAIVRSHVSGEVVEQVQADLEGRYAVRVPIFYGSTHTSVEATPLGGQPYEVINAHYLTPERILPSGVFEYELRTGRHLGSGSVSWGVLENMTIHSAGSWPRGSARIGASGLIGRTLFLHSEADVMNRSLEGSFRWRSDEGGLQARYRHRAPTKAHDLSTHAWMGIGNISVYASATRRSTETTDATTNVHGMMAYRSRGGLRVQTRADWNPDRGHRTGLLLQYPLPVRILVEGGTEMTADGIRSIRGAVHGYRGAWSGRLQVLRDVERSETGLSLFVQLNSDWVQGSALIQSRAGQFQHHQSLRGTVLIGEDFRFSALFHENTQAIFRPFVDMNLNGTKDPEEPIAYGTRIRMGGGNILNRSSGEIQALNLEPYKIYPAEIIQSSIPDPTLYPVTGYVFSITSRPGRTRYIDIPLQPLPVLEGRITGWDGPYTLLQVYLNGQAVDVYRDGGFFLQTPPGEARITVRHLLTDRTMIEMDTSIQTGHNSITIPIPPEAE